MKIPDPECSEDNCIFEELVSATPNKNQEEDFAQPKIFAIINFPCYKTGTIPWTMALPKSLFPFERQRERETLLLMLFIAEKSDLARVPFPIRSRAPFEDSNNNNNKRSTHQDVDQDCSAVMSDCDFKRITQEQT